MNAPMSTSYIIRIWSIVIFPSLSLLILSVDQINIFYHSNQAIKSVTALWAAGGKRATQDA